MAGEFSFSITSFVGSFLTGLPQPPFNLQPSQLELLIQQPPTSVFTRIRSFVPGFRAAKRVLFMLQGGGFFFPHSKDSHYILPPSIKAARTPHQSPFFLFFQA